MFNSIKKTKNTSFIYKNKQIWKMYVFVLGIIFGGVIMVLGLISITEGSKHIEQAIIGIFIGIVSFVFGCISVKCPKCNLRLVWWSLKNKSIDNWLIWIFSSKKCPKCGLESRIKGSASLIYVAVNLYSVNGTLTSNSSP